MEKIRTGWTLPPMPLPIALMGANVSGKPNFFTIAWFTMLRDNPPLIGAAMGKTYHTKKGIDENKTFSLNIPSAHMAEIVDYCGLYSGAQVDKSRLFEVFYGDLKTAPMIKICPLNIECRMIDSKNLETMVLIVGEIVQIYCEEKYLSENKPDLRKMDPMMFFMPEGPYIRTGEVVAQAFEVGKNYEK